MAFSHPELVPDEETVESLARKVNAWGDTIADEFNRVIGSRFSGISGGVWTGTTGAASSGDSGQILIKHGLTTRPSGMLIQCNLAVGYDVLSSSGWASVTPPDTLRAKLYRYDSFSGLILPLDNTQVEVTWLAFAAIGKYAEQTG